MTQKSTYIIHAKLLINVCGKSLPIIVKKKYKDVELTAREAINKMLQSKVTVRTKDKNDRKWMMKRTVSQLRGLAHEYHESMWKRNLDGSKVEVKL